MRSNEKADQMFCVYCKEWKNHRDGFPNRQSAECWQCAWDGHTRSRHSREVRRIRRIAKRRARRIKQADITAAMTRRERALVLGPTDQDEETP